MAGKRQRANGWEYVFKRAGLLEKPIYMTFPTEAEGDAYAERLERLLDRGIIPSEHQVQSARVSKLGDLIGQYLREAHPSPKDRGSLATIERSHGETPLSILGVPWVDAWIKEMKRVDRVKPGTIIAKVGALARCADWGIRAGLLVLPDHPFRTLPKGYAQYTAEDAAIAGGVIKDGERDRRLEEGEFDRLLAAIEAGTLPRKQRPFALPDPRALRCLVTLAVESAMRLREMYTLTLDQVMLPKRTVFLDKTKNGDKRQVPLSSVALATLKDYLKVRAIPAEHPKEMLFPWWDGSTEKRDLDALTDMLSKLFVEIAAEAKCPGLLFHDLRHEAVSRLFERTTLSDTQIMKITGHKSHKMLMRYLHLRGSALSDALW